MSKMGESGDGQAPIIVALGGGVLTVETTGQVGWPQGMSAVYMRVAVALSGVVPHNGAA